MLGSGREPRWRTWARFSARLRAFRRRHGLAGSPYFDRAKWWAFELRFERPLTQREVRLLRQELNAVDPGIPVGTDGAVGDWPHSFPGETDTREAFQRVARRVGVPGRYRMAPYGRDCPGGVACAYAFADEEDHRCELGRSGPVRFTEQDWISLGGSCDDA